MDAIVVGLVPSPGMPEKITSKIVNKLSTNIKEENNWNINLKFEIKKDPITDSSEHINKAMHIINRIREEKNWDYIIGLTDLPRFSKKKTIISDVNISQNSALIFLPSLGAINMTSKAHNIIKDILNDLLSKTAQYNPQHIKKMHITTNRLSKVNKLDFKNKKHVSKRYIINSRMIGKMQTISGMTYLNQPWKAITSFTKILSLSFATGTYISIFPTPWQLSDNFSLIRFIMLTLIAIIGMVVWLMYTHNLWEPKASANKRKYRFIYNITTFTTLSVVTITNYLILYIMLTLMIVFFIPETLFTMWGKANPEHSALNYLKLSWFITSLGVIVGAFGSTMQKKEKIRKITYSYRQLNRYYRAKSSNKK
ncbi:hypothetical protein J3T78_06240 [Staphylococcus nepalensis]|uniref:5,10-methylene-tetrahydrofolate dehydrogenase n=1 Tax=Staphylococcus nepalensis TaxID=214473 RepID=A0ABS3L0D3_9STAP|nr:hypothetical protein [Staphylococcus nepalensis]MBO1213566.1 hypothetical protein [Staphylococcus nepalensis]MBO1215212.1 hypothetical protein [Staphylococcus nepalensis]MBO1225854.1 hypothetical protein [Staphylococcus nepalensis]MBO1234282.1 hypothetical protein [Staphylococcus nepalensis]MBO1237313.1 hypothetical protein [Staphylococcus nepalensis]